MEDREGVGRVVRGGNEVPALLCLQHRRVAIAGEDAGMQILGDQRLPARLALPVSLGGRAVVNVRHPHAEITGQRAEESEIIVMLAARQHVIAPVAGPRHGKARTLAFGLGLYLKQIHSSLLHAAFR
jgi:hypothetical protein